MSETTCERHDWAPSPGPDPDFRRNRLMWVGERAHVECRVCHARSWLPREAFTYSCLICGETTPLPHDCKAFRPSPRAATTEGGTTT